jgi:hypothetical protein
MKVRGLALKIKKHKGSGISRPHWTDGRRIIRQVAAHHAATNCSSGADYRRDHDSGRLGSAFPYPVCDVLA